MTDIMNMFGRLREALTSQFTSYRVKKSDLIEAYYQVGRLDYSCRKLELANMLSAIIISDLENDYKCCVIEDLPNDQLKKEITIKLHAKLESFNLRGLSITKKIQDIFNFETITHNNNMINNRLVKISQQNVENIWTSHTKPIQCLCPKAPFNLEQTQKVEICYRCEQKYHSDCFWGPERGEELFQCPFCYMKFCAPQKEVKQILFGGYLPILKKQKIEYKISFLLDKIKLDKSAYLQARCVKFNRQNRYQMSWPDNCSFSIGKMKIAQFKPLQTSSPLKRRADEPIKLDRNRLQHENQIIIEERYTSQTNFKLNKKCYHLVAIMVIAELPNQLVLSKFEKNQLPISESKQFLTKYMFHEKGDILIEKISISLKCQYYGAKMKLPARSRHCNTHMQPFDLMNFINSSILAKTSTRKWKCPICDKRAYDLVIDKYILTLMQENPSVNEIIFRENGEPEMIQGKQDENSDMESENGERIAEYEKKQKLKPNIVIDIDLDEQPIPQLTFEAIVNGSKYKEGTQDNKQQNKELIIESEEDAREKNRKQLKIQKTKGNIKLNEEVVEPLEIKKIRKLNDGSLEIADSTSRKKKMDMHAIGKILVELSSDGEDFPIKTHKNLQPLPLTQKEKDLLTAVKKVKLTQKNERGQNRTEKQKSERIKAASQKLDIATLPKSKSKPEQKQKEKPKISKNVQREKPKEFFNLEVINIDSDGQANHNDKQNENQMEVAVSKEKRDETLLNMLEDVMKNVDRNGKQPVSDQDKDLFQELFSKILEITEDEK